MNVNVISVDGVEPITIEEAKEQCYIPTTDSDVTTFSILDSLIKATREYAESKTWRTLVDKTLEYRCDIFPYGETSEHTTGKLNRNIIEIPNPPLREVVSIKYILNGSEQTLDPSNYVVDTRSTPGRIEPVQFWPNTDDVIDAVRIRYTAGYGDDNEISSVPESLKIAMKMHIKALYDNRDAFVLLDRSGEYHIAPMGTDAILNLHSVQKFV
jgi:uncharacterized phiE125 gp8 family phage protein